MKNLKGFDLWEELDNVPCLSQKILMDLANGIEVTGEKIRYVSSQGTLSKIIGFIDGSNERRSHIIIEGHQAVMESVICWMSELTSHVDCTMKADAEIIDKLTQAREYMMGLSRLALENRERIEAQIQKLNSIEQKVNNLHVDMKHFKSKDLIDKIITSWEAQKIFNGYSPLVQVAFLLEELDRRHRNCGIHLSKENLQYTIERILIGLKSLYGIRPDTFLRFVEWLDRFVIGMGSERNILTAYLLEPKKSSPLLAVISQYAETENISEEFMKENRISYFYRNELLIERLARETLGSCENEGDENEQARL
jgi:hypothetical protein